ncbi:MAG: hypothetical protein JWM35_932 [Verrucomicrobia bacterium]|nr:hypothetical protein [Verrucomicrobiota bacterium]
MITSLRERARRGRRFLFGALAGLGIFFTGARAADGLNERIEFDFGAGNADVVLKQFAEQSGRQVIFPTALVQGLRLPGLKGKFTPRDGLEHILVRTTLTAWEDERTGALAIGRDASLAPDGAVRTPPPIRLPPFVVEEKSEVHWRYAEAPGIEVLSQCSDTDTVALMAQHYLLHELLSVLVPESLRFKSEVPTTYIFFKEARRSTVTKELLASLQRRAAEAAAAGDKGAEKVEVRPLANYRFWDEDTLAVFIIWSEYDRTPIMPTSSYVRSLLDRRTPSLPTWFIEGMVDVYERALMHTKAPGAEIAVANGFQTPIGKPAPNTVTLRRPIWIDEKITEVLKESLAGGRAEFEAKVAQLHAEPLPLGELMSDRIPAGHSESYDRRRRSTAALFIRFMLSEGRGLSKVTATSRATIDGIPSVKVSAGSRTNALWSFIAAVSAQRGTERDFKAAFGRNYAEADVELRDAFPSLIAQQNILEPEKISQMGPVDLRDASDADVSRVKGTFNRLEVSYVEELYPSLTAEYVEQARRTLRRSYDAGDRDPRLLAEIGLCEVDAKNDAAARPFLEAAVDAKISGPRSYYELARIRYEALLAKNRNAKLNAADLANVLAPLHSLESHVPPLAEAYELMASAWLRSDAVVTNKDFAAVSDAVRLFPRRGRLSLSAALLAISRNDRQNAEVFIEHGLEYATTPSEADRFNRLAELIGSRRK